MAYLVHEASVDLVKKEAHVIFRNPPSDLESGASISVSFEYQAVPADGLQSKRVVQEAVQVLSEALDEISKLGT